MAVTDPDGIVTAEFDTRWASVRFTILGTAWPLEVSRITIHRSKGRQPVRIRGGDARAVGGFLVISDNEAPLDSVVSYTVRGYSAADVLVKTVSLSVPTTGAEPGIWLKLAGDPNATSHANQKAISDVISATQGGIYQVAGGQGVGVGVYGGRDATEFGLTLQVLTTDKDAAIANTFRKGRIVLLQHVSKIAPFEAGWYFIKQVSRALFAQADGVEGAIWSIEVAATTRPSGDSAGVAGVSYALLTARYPTYADMKATGLTYFELAQGR